MNWKIKKFKELNIEELYKILALRNEVFIVEQECPYLDCDDKDFNSYHLFSEENGEIVSYLRIIENGNSQISIGRVIVRKNYRKKGYGKEAIQLAINYLFKTQRYNAIHLEVFSYNQNAYEMYKKFGFKECGRWHQVRYHDGISQDVILMELLRKEYCK